MSKIALITGASRGIGAATAELAAKSGYDVAVNYARDGDAAAQIVDRCRTNGHRAVALQSDIADPDAVEDMFAACDDALGTPDLLVNNAGIIGQASRFVDLTPDALQRTMAVNLFGTIYCAQAAARRMSKAQGGRGGAIINISSIAAVLGSPGEYVHYAASKGAVETLTIGLGKELGPDGIRVNCIRAGTTDTDIHGRSGNPDRPAMVARAAPLGRVAAPGDIAAAALWLASEDADYITASILPVAGGL
ncbi:MAG: SDR family oxidoreductase [Pseudomonadota bacterium]